MRKCPFNSEYVLIRTNHPFPFFTCRPAHPWRMLTRMGRLLWCGSHRTQNKIATRLALPFFTPPGLTPPCPASISRGLKSPHILPPLQCMAVNLGLTPAINALSEAGASKGCRIHYAAQHGHHQVRFPLSDMAFYR